MQESNAVHLVVHGAVPVVQQPLVSLIDVVDHLALRLGRPQPLVPQDASVHELIAS